MAEVAGLSPSAVGRIGRALALTPPEADTFKLSTDPFVVEDVRGVVGLYVSPPANALVLRVDEKSPVQGLDGTRRCRP